MLEGISKDSVKDSEKNRGVWRQSYKKKKHKEEVQGTWFTFAETGKKRHRKKSS